MKKTVKADLRAKSVEDLRTEANGLRKDLLTARVAATVQGKSKGMQYREVRRRIARIETLITEKTAVAAVKA